MRISKPLIFTSHKDLREEYEFLFKLKTQQEILKQVSSPPLPYPLNLSVRGTGNIFTHVYSSGGYPWYEVRTFIRKYRKEYGLRNGFSRAALNL